MTGFMAVWQPSARQARNCADARRAFQLPSPDAADTMAMAGVNTWLFLSLMAMGSRQRSAISVVVTRLAAMDWPMPAPPPVRSACTPSAARPSRSISAASASASGSYSSMMSKSVCRMCGTMPLLPTMRGRVSTTWMMTSAAASRVVISSDECASTVQQNSSTSFRKGLSTGTADSASSAMTPMASAAMLSSYASTHCCVTAITGTTRVWNASTFSCVASPDMRRHTARSAMNRTGASASARPASSMPRTLSKCSVMKRPTVSAM
mmetsp:Transcript_24167/g.83910  ORF Transcript_24167/g.83910 Transcript_24167/m.83910 type:complete len:265 (+) Transcript_24167:2325-3119(+)